MKQLTKESAKLIEETLRTVDVYHVSCLHPNVLKYEVCPKGSTNRVASLRYNYLLSSSGLLTTINNYYSYLRRLFEYFSNGNNANTLRQRLNITQTLIDCDSKTAVPVHISIGVKENTGIVDLDNFDNKSYRTVTHPGYTRASGSVFLNLPLKNVLIYVKKEHNLKFIDKPYLTKINTPDDLLPYYNTLLKEDNKKYTLDFLMPMKEGSLDYRNNLKIHPSTDTPIFKLKKIIDIEYTGKDTNKHPMVEYVENTFKSFDKFCEILFSASITIYHTDNRLIHKNIEENFSTFLQKFFDTGKDKAYDIKSILEYHNYVPVYGGSAYHPSKSTISDEQGIYKKMFELKALDKKEDIYLLEKRLNTVMLTEDMTVEDIVSKNNYKGIVFVVKKEAIPYIKRTYQEFLFIVNPFTPILKTDDNNIQIINCSHSYWKDKKNYKETIIPYSFFTLE